eukprot:m.6277 g.6277  ORF g.6277 m.6277 type:complete len:74 (-) comp4734_c0_seq1:58-279(-)
MIGKTGRLFTRLKISGAHPHLLHTRNDSSRPEQQQQQPKCMNRALITSTELGSMSTVYYIVVRLFFLKKKKAI